MTLHMLDVGEQDGPYWRAYQAERARSRITDNPDYVPDWFLIKLMRERLQAARIELEQLSGAGADPMFERMRTIWEALGELVDFIDYGAASDPIGAREHVLAALLGAQEIETTRERVQYELEPATPPCTCAAAVARP